MQYEGTRFILVAACSVCLLVLMAACAQAPVYWPKAPPSATQKTKQPHRAPYAENLITKKLPTPSLIWREGERKIIQYAGQADNRRTPNCTLLVFLDGQEEIVNLISQPLSERAPKDGAACLRVWQRFSNGRG